VYYVDNVALSSHTCLPIRAFGKQRASGYATGGSNGVMLIYQRCALASSAYHTCFHLFDPCRDKGTRTRMLRSFGHESAEPGIRAQTERVSEPFARAQPFCTEEILARIVFVARLEDLK
jgi:hypothetical protein